MKEVHLHGDGDPSLIMSRLVAIVGSQTASAYGLKSARRMVERLIEAELTVLTGTDEGIERAAVEETIRRNSRMVCVLPCGIDLQSGFPITHAVKQADGLITTELPDGTKPDERSLSKCALSKAELAHAVIMIEGTAGSTAFRTAQTALESGKPVGILASKTNDASTLSSRMLVRRDARWIETAEDLQEFLGLVAWDLVKS